MNLVKDFMEKVAKIPITPGQRHARKAEMEKSILDKAKINMSAVRRDSKGR